MAVDKIAFGSELYMKAYAKEGYHLAKSVTACVPKYNSRNEIVGIEDDVDTSTSPNPNVIYTWDPDFEKESIPTNAPLVGEIVCGGVECYVFITFTKYSYARYSPGETISNGKIITPRMMWYMAPKYKCTLTKN